MKAHRIAYTKIFWAQVVQVQPYRTGKEALLQAKSDNSGDTRLSSEHKTSTTRLSHSVHCIEATAKGQNS